MKFWPWLHDKLDGINNWIYWHKLKQKPSHIDALDLTEQLPKGSVPRVEDVKFTPKDAREYAVTGPPRHIPWSRRRKELEQEARQKRRQLESFQEPQ